MGSIFSNDDLSDALEEQRNLQESEIRAEKKKALQERKEAIDQQREQMGVGAGRYKTATTGKTGVRGRLSTDEDILG